MAFLSWIWTSQPDPKIESTDATRDGKQSSKPSACPMRSNTTASQSCPVPPERRDHPMILLDPRNNMRAGGESQYPGLGQQAALPQGRQLSSIPKADHTPIHQQGTEEDKWVYPSEQMFYNAMQRKGWSPREEDMKSVVAIHNAVNEQTWKEVMKWEKLHCDQCPQPKLIRFFGRPTDYSPKARIRGLFGYQLPFDRHDWFVDRCGKQVRYVIDFYNGKPDPTKPVSFYLDVRPALDDWQSVADRVRMMTSPWFAPQPTTRGAAKSA